MAEMRSEWVSQYFDLVIYAFKTVRDNSPRSKNTVEILLSLTMVGTEDIGDNSYV